MQAKPGDIVDLADSIEQFGHRKVFVDDVHYNPSFAIFLAHRMARHIPSRRRVVSFLVHSVLTALYLTLLGLPSARLLCPKTLQKYALALAPLLGSALLMPLFWPLWAHRLSSRQPVAMPVVLIALVAGAWSWRRQPWEPDAVAVAVLEYSWSSLRPQPWNGPAVHRH